MFKNILFTVIALFAMAFSGCDSTSGDDGNIGNGYADEYQHNIKMKPNYVLSVNLATNEQKKISIGEYYYNQFQEQNNTTTVQEDEENVTATYYIVEHPAYGSLEMSGDTITYFPNDDFTGVDHFNISKGTVRDEVFVKYYFTVTVQ